MSNVYTYKLKVSTKGIAIEKIFKQKNYFSAKSQENRYFDVLISEK